MRVLVDTQVFLWALGGFANLEKKVLRFLSDTERNEFFVSVASAWEISIKFGLGKLRLPDSPERFFPNRLRRAGFKSLPIQLPHVLYVHSLPEIHRDPFDRLLISQAKAEGLTILTADPIFGEYDVELLNVLKFRK